jgi:excisionase family DNA binding protein
MAGVTIAAIAAAEGVGFGTVVRATTAFGPFPAPRRQPGRPSDPEFLTVDEVAAELAVGPQVAYQMIRNGSLPARRGAGGRHDVERQVFERWISQQHRLTREWIAANPGNFGRGI